MKILFVAPTYFDETSIIGGGERYVEKFAEAMARKCELHVYSFGPKAKTFIRNGVHYRIFRFRRFGQFTKSNPFAIRHYLAIRKGSFDVVHTHQMCTFVTDIACLAASHARIPVVTTDHGGGGAWVLNNRFPIFPRYAVAIGQSSIASQLLRPNFEKRIETLKGGVSLEEFHPEKPAIKENWVLFVGRLLPHKGVHTLIDAFRKAALPDFELIVLGRATDQNYFEKLKKMALGAPIRFVTSANDNDLKHFYRKSKVTVLPSEKDEYNLNPPELMGFTSLESQASGTPVVVSDGGPMAEFIQEERTGFVFENKNSDALAEALKKAASLYDAYPLESIISNCRDWVTQYSWETLADQHLQLYARLLHFRSTPQKR